MKKQLERFGDFYLILVIQKCTNLKITFREIGCNLIKVGFGNIRLNFLIWSTLSYTSEIR